VAGILSAGGICSHLIGSETHDLSFKEMLDFIGAQPQRTCVPVPGMTICADDQTSGIPQVLPSRGAAIMLSSEDTRQLLTELAVMCRALGRRCSYATRRAIESTTLRLDSQLRTE
jgi:hypothetical protein